MITLDIAELKARLQQAFPEFVFLVGERGSSLTPDNFAECEKSLKDFMAACASNAEVSLTRRDAA